MQDNSAYFAFTKEKLMENQPLAETIQIGWYWHHHSQRPAYVHQSTQGWQARFVWADPDHFGAFHHDGLLNSLNVALSPELYLQLVPLFRRPTMDHDRRRNPPYPLVLPCQHCGILTPSSFMPAGDGTWIARPVCDAHQETAE
ncbi:MAG: hypothetical protein CYG59_16395 [Chloroflexi bacterium]|nr:MAG: hypothetical protein CYG59_16395 [Chloroflexota bacterium]